MRTRVARLLGVLGAAALVACESPFGGPAVPKITVTSSAFAEGQAIPRQYTCDGANISPPLAWTSLPEATKSLALITDDPISRRVVIVHWVLYDLPANGTALPEKIAQGPTLPNGAKQGPNDLETTGYSGPCPPAGNPHTYAFKLYALDAPTGLKAGATKQELLDAMKGHIVAQGELKGTYQRASQ